jgi:hypothetical protein
MNRYQINEKENGQFTHGGKGTVTPANCQSDKQIKVICAVAHMDHDEWNKDVSMDRLQYLCQKCHLELDYEDNLRRLDPMRSGIKKERKIRNISTGYLK